MVKKTEGCVYVVSVQRKMLALGRISQLKISIKSKANTINPRKGILSLIFLFYLFIYLFLWHTHSSLLDT